MSLIKLDRTGKIKAAVRLVVGLGLLALLFWQVDLREIGGMIPTIDAVFFSLALLFAVLDRCLMAYKWNLLMRARDIVFSFAKVFKISLISWFFGIFLPTSLGSDVIKTVYASAEKGNSARIAASVLLEKMLGVVGAGAAAVLGLLIMNFFHMGTVFNLTNTLILIVFFIGSAIVTWWMLQNRGIEIVSGTFEKLGIRTNRFTRLILEGQRALSEYRGEKRLITLFLILTIAEQGVNVLISYWAGLSLGLNMELYYFLGIVPVARIISRLPISADGLGVQEGLFVFFFSLAGLTIPESLALAIMTRVAYLASILPGSVFYVMDGLKSAQGEQAVR